MGVGLRLSGCFPMAGGLQLDACVGAPLCGRPKNDREYPIHKRGHPTIHEHWFPIIDENERSIIDERGASNHP